MDSVYHELEIALEPRGYFNVLYQMRAGHTPAKIDYLLRVHYGGRTWLNPTVRMDRITWGNDGIVSNKYMTNLASNGLFDPRVGLSFDEEMSVRRLFSMPVLPKDEAMTAGGPRGFAPDENVSLYASTVSQAATDFCLVVVEAFKFEDVKAMDKKAHCIWATFVAVPVTRGQAFSKVLRSMLATASPYFGTTTKGLQVYEVPYGKVLMGNPVEVPEKSSQPTEQGNPSVPVRN